jgi:hypothetical protein
MSFETYTKRNKAMQDRQALYERAIKKLGPQHQLGIVQEECSELISAISKYRRGRITAKQLATEIADVQIMVDQARLIVGPNEVDQAIPEQLERLRQVVDGERG